MKSFLKLSVVCLCLLGSAHLFAQDRYPLNRAINILRQNHNPPNKEKALADLTAYANEGSVEAMHALGMLYLQGFSIETNYDLSRFFFEKASSLGYDRSSYNLAMIYRRGIGVEQNFETALYYLKEAAKFGNPQTLYGIGYFYYKGLGVEQSYSNAIKFFEIAASHQHAMAAYMLGLCYRNGYGVERDIARGNLWLEEAKLLGNIRANAELMKDSPERPLHFVQTNSIIASLKEKSLETHQRITHSAHSCTSIEGRYTGVLITYDWSGKYPVSESFLDVTFEQRGNNIWVRWMEEGATEVVATATLTDSTLIFTEAVYFKKDHFRRQNPRAWNFVKATLNYINEAGQVVLSGNLHLYSPDIKEPGQPRTFVLQPKQTENLIADKPIFNVGNELFFSTNTVFVYPNPFTDYLNVSFMLEEDSNCEIEIYSISGALLHRQRLGKLREGVHRHQVNIGSFVYGTYVLRLIYGDRSYTTIIIKEN
jgi:TPR repeat protein